MYTGFQKLVRFSGGNALSGTEFRKRAGKDAGWPYITEK